VLQISSGATLVNSGTVEIQGGCTIGGCFIDNFGTITNLSGGTINNAGGIDNQAGGIINNNAGGIINNNNGASVHNEAGGIVNNGGTINNNGGTFNIDNYGTFNNQAGGVINIGSFGELINQAGGVLNNGGTINNKVGGEIDDYGAIDNFYTIDNYGTTIIECGGTITEEPNSGATFIQERGSTLTYVSCATSVPEFPAISAFGPILLITLLLPVILRLTASLRNTVMHISSGPEVIPT